MDQPLAIFVYGTLKRGHVREACWPRRPVKVEAAAVRGTLYDLGPYPALVEGSDLVAGELWHFAAEDLPATLAALDRIEGYSGGAGDLYRRAVIECRSDDGTVKAWTYWYARATELETAQRVKPDKDGLCRWPDLVLGTE
jgi:gamma-glutamylcyclotransferase (GGCT)/AIG2-like uncharacterized protein YtfP